MLMSLTNRVNTLLLVLLVLMAAAIIAILANRASAGPLDPPGPPSSTSGVLRPGTPITTLPFTISAPGNYYLTKNLSLASPTNGITVDADDVTLDLGGFQLSGSAGAVTAIVSVNPHSGLTVENGSIVGWAQGIGVASVNQSRFDRLRLRLVQTFQASLVGLVAGDAAMVDAVDVEGANSGIALGQVSRISDCHVDGLGAPGASSFGEGVAFSTRSSLDRCTIVGFNTGIYQSGDAGDIRDCNIQGGAASIGYGVFLAGYTLMTGCTIGADSGTAVRLFGPEDVLTNNRIEAQQPGQCVITNNAAQIQGNQLFNCGTIFSVADYTRIVGNLLSTSGTSINLGAIHADLGTTVPASASSSPWINPYGP